MTRPLFAIFFTCLFAACSGGGAGLGAGSAGAGSSAGGSTAAAAGSASGRIAAVERAAATGGAPAAVAPAAAATGTIVDLAAAANVEAIGRDGAAVGHGGIDGLGDAYAANLLGAAVDWAGIAFTLGVPGTLDAVGATTVKLPAGHFAWLNLLGTAVDGDQTDQTFVVGYADGTSTPFTRSMSDWYTPQSYAGESTVLREAHRLYADGSPDDRPFALYGYRLALDPSKVVAYLRLPANRSVIVLAMTLTAGAPVNVVGTGNVEAIDDAGAAPLAGGLDGLGNAYASSLLGPQAAWSGVNFALGAAGTRGAWSSTTLSLPAGAWSTLLLLATGVNGSQPAQRFVVTYGDGTRTTFTQSLSDWHFPQNYAGEAIALTEAYRNDARTGRDAGPFYVYGYSFAVDASRSVQSVTLPGNRDVVVLAATLLPAAPPSGGTSSGGSGSGSGTGSRSGSGSGGGGGPGSGTGSGTASGTAAISWVAPTASTDGTPLTDLAGYRIYYGPSADAMSHVIEVAGADVLTHEVTGLSPGRWYFCVEAYTAAGASSGPSATVSETVD